MRWKARCREFAAGRWRGTGGTRVSVGVCEPTRFPKVGGRPTRISFSETSAKGAGSVPAQQNRSRVFVNLSHSHRPPPVGDGLGKYFMRRVAPACSQKHSELLGVASWSGRGALGPWASQGFPPAGRPSTVGFLMSLATDLCLHTGWRRPGVEIGNNLCPPQARV